MLLYPNTMVSFENTELAFKSKSNHELNKAYWLFKLISYPTLVKLSSHLAPVSIKIGFKSLIKHTIFKQFVGGESIDECSKTITALAQYNIGTILDYSVEGKECEADFENCMLETIATIDKANNNNHIPFCVFKITGLARFELLEKVSTKTPLTEVEKLEFKKVEHRVNTICKKAADSKQPIFIDAEESWIQPCVDELADANMKLHNTSQAIIFNTYQFYRHDSLAFLTQSIKRAQTENYIVGAKLVRGAYMEKERKRAQDKQYKSPINIDKQATDKLFNEAIDICMTHIQNIAFCIGTHNEESTLKLIKLMKQNSIANNHPHVSFAQLYGMSDHISFNLSANNYNVAKYVPYGPVKDVLPYLIRRAQENTSVKGQTGRELNLILAEKKRRKIKYKKYNLILYFH